KPWDGLSDIEKRMVFALAEVLSSKQLRQAHQLRAVLRSLAHPRHSLLQVRLGRGLTRHLNQRNASRTLRHRTLLNRSNSALDSLHTRKGAGSKPAPSHSRALKILLVVEDQNRCGDRRRPPPVLVADGGLR